MFERVQFDSGQTVITLTAFVLCFSAFVFFCWRAIRMRKRERDRLANLPFESEQDRQSTSHE